MLDAGNDFTGNLKWDLGGRAFTLGIIKSIKLAQGRLVELGTAYAEKSGVFNLEAAIKPHKDHRLTATYVTFHELMERMPKHAHRDPFCDMLARTALACRDLESAFFRATSS